MASNIIDMTQRCHLIEVQLGAFGDGWHGKFTAMDVILTRWVALVKLSSHLAQGFH